MTPTSGPLHILLVDDSRVVRDVVAQMLVALGHVVTPAEGAERALRLLADGPPVDIVFTDYQMPGMNGIDLAREIRRRWPAVSLALISGTGEGMELPTDLFQRVLVKPVTLGRLRAALGGVPGEAPRGPAVGP